MKLRRSAGLIGLALALAGCAASTNPEQADRSGGITAPRHPTVTINPFCDQNSLLPNAPASDYGNCYPDGF